jgi:hypothetical protein
LPGNPGSHTILNAMKLNNPSFPLGPKHEAFAAAVANGHKLQQAHKLAGFEGATYAAAWQLRRNPKVDARIRWMLEERVKADTRAFTRRQKGKGDLLQRALKRLEDIAFVDVREVANWRREPVLNADGEVIGEGESLMIRDSRDLTPAAAAAIKNVFTKSGRIRVEMHDAKAALVDIVKLLSGSDAQPSGGNVTVNQINVGETGALEALKRVSFLLAAARAREPAVKTIDHDSTDMDDKTKP